MALEASFAACCPSVCAIASFIRNSRSNSSLVFFNFSNSSSSEKVSESLFCNSLILSFVVFNSSLRDFISEIVLS